MTKSNLFANTLIIITKSCRVNIKKTRKIYDFVYTILQESFEFSKSET